MKRNGDDRRGRAADRRRRKAWMLHIFGNGEVAPCVHCGQDLTFDTMEQDRIVPGGPYNRQMCNRDVAADLGLSPSVEGKRGQQQPRNARCKRPRELCCAVRASFRGGQSRVWKPGDLSRAILRAGSSHRSSGVRRQSRQPRPLFERECTCNVVIRNSSRMALAHARGQTTRELWRKPPVSLIKSLNYVNVGT